MVGIAKQTVGDAPHVDQVIRIGADATQNPENGLDEQRRRDQTPVEEVRQAIEVPHVVALEFETGATALAQEFQHPLDILEGVAEDEIA